MFLKHVINVLQLVEFGRMKYTEAAEVVAILCSSSTTRILIANGPIRAGHHW
jgi:hypothetical protein